jgi:hypothetical protein
VWAKLRSLYAGSAWAQSVTLLAGTSGEGAAQDCSLVGLGSATHCGGGHDM